MKHCPSCGSEKLRSFYNVKGVPVNNCFLADSKEEALNAAKGDIDLAFCSNCGFITNTAFKSSSLDYSLPYENQQAFSPTFNAFSKSLAEKLVDKYDLHNKKILEIGCGKGDFLSLICELGDNRGIGVDPGCTTERLKDEKVKRITMIREPFSEKHSKHIGDLILCRHTFEHIHDTAEFLSVVRKAIGERFDTVLVFEIPSVLRILREQAFWDIYYEHSSYFSPGSIARLFRKCGFEVLDLYLGYDDQYIVIEAKASAGESKKMHPLEESIEDLKKDVEDFGKKYSAKFDEWKKKVKSYKSKGKRIAIWGSGSKCLSFITTLEMGDEIDLVVDINPFRHHKFIPGTSKEIMPPESLWEEKPDVVVIMNPVYETEIRKLIEIMKLDPEIVSL